MQRITILHPFLFALYFPLFLFAHNIEQLPMGIVVRPIIIILVFTLFLFVTVKLVVKSKQKSALFTSLVVVFFFTYGQCHSAIEYLFGFGQGHKVLLTAWLLILIIGGYGITQYRKSFSNINTITTVVATSLLIFCCLNIGLYEARSTAPAHGQTVPNYPAVSESADYPDIYYIVPDTYANANTLSRFFDYDNSYFTGYLQEKGFYVADRSFANYPKTFLSLASSLNMQYLCHLREVIGEDSSNQVPVYAMLQDYEVWRFLKARGYRFIHFGSWWEPTKTNRYADENINYNKLGVDEYSRQLLELTMIYPVAERVFGLDPLDEQRERVLYKFDRLAEIPDIKGPKFVVVHLLIPHPPYVFGPAGEPITRRDAREKSEQQLYLDQVTFTNQKMQVAVDEILRKSKNSPIIVIQADEGPYLHEEFEGDYGGEETDWTQLGTEALLIHMGIINAYHLPGFGEEVLYETISPVNTFRLIFNLYFGAEYELLEDRSYIFEDLNHPYRFVDVTDRLR